MTYLTARKPFCATGPWPQAWLSRVVSLMAAVTNSADAPGV
jgi:hypothetical protein